MFPIVLSIPDSPPADLRDAEQLTFGQQVVEARQPSADGRWLYYDSDDDARLTSGPELGTDGQYFYFRRESQQSDIWLASTSVR